ncbi:sulfur oxidation protein [Marinomonas sp. 42_23_T18]|nr:sulfur oxidation protein [Marinomonas sp. 42_23_T18]
MSNTLIHITSSPYSGLKVKEALDLAMVLATFEQKVELAFSGAGIALLHQDQQPSNEQGKALFKMLASFEFYDLDKLYLPASQLPSDEAKITSLASVLSDQEWTDMLTRYQHTFRF